MAFIAPARNDGVGSGFGWIRAELTTFADSMAGERGDDGEVCRAEMVAR